MNTKMAIKRAVHPKPPKWLNDNTQTPSWILLAVTPSQMTLNCRQLVNENSKSKAGWMTGEQQRR
jgi:hypothetical protein